MSTYASAYNSHLRCLAETNDSAIPGDAEAASPGTSVLYRAYMVGLRLRSSLHVPAYCYRRCMMLFMRLLVEGQSPCELV